MRLKTAGKSFVLFTFKTTATMRKEPIFEATKEEDFKPITISSTAFQQNGTIPVQYTCDGTNTNPPFALKQIPEEALSLAIIVDDPDAPAGTWTHWLVWNIPVTHQIPEGFHKGVQGLNDFKKKAYGGPCPPSGEHRYFFKIYALDCVLDLPAGAGRKDLEKAMSEHIMAMGVYIGRYAR